MAVPYVETDCTFTHAGQTFESGGSAVSEAFAVAYVKAEDARPYRGQRVTLTTWHGEEIGHGRITAVWRVSSYIGSHMCQIEGKIEGRTYTGRSFGSGMVWQGKRIAAERKAA